MDDQGNQQNQNQQNSTGQSQVSTQTIAQPTGSVSKEGGPMPVQDVLTPSSQEYVEISPELQKIGVEASEAEQISEQAKQAGVQASHQNISAPTVKEVIVTHLPMTAAQAQAIVKTTKDNTKSEKWLALLIMKVLQMQDKYKQKIAV